MCSRCSIQWGVLSVQRAVQCQCPVCAVCSAQYVHTVCSAQYVQYAVPSMYSVQCPVCRVCCPNKEELTRAAKQLLPFASLHAWLPISYQSTLQVLTKHQHMLFSWSELTLLNGLNLNPFFIQNIGKATPSRCPPPCWIGHLSYHSKAFWWTFTMYLIRGEVFNLHWSEPICHILLMYWLE